MEKLVCQKNCIKRQERGLAKSRLDIGTEKGITWDYKNGRDILKLNDDDDWKGVVDVSIVTPSINVN